MPGDRGGQIRSLFVLPCHHGVLGIINPIYPSHQSITTPKSYDCIYAPFTEVIFDEGKDITEAIHQQSVAKRLNKEARQLTKAANRNN